MHKTGGGRLHRVAALTAGALLVTDLGVGAAMLAAPAAAAARTHPIVATADPRAPRVAARPAVTLELRPEGPRAHARLASIAHRSAINARVAGANRSTLAELTPSASTRLAVERYFTARGMRIVAASRWTVSVGGPTRALAKIFDTSVRRAHGYVVPTSRLHVPAALRAAVSGAVGLDTRPLYRHAALPAGGYAGPDIRSAYGATASGSGAGLTVATIEYSPLNTGDVQTYANAAGIGIGAGQITAIGVAGAAPTGDDGAGTQEAVLDTEALLAVAPAARQRVYVAANTLASYVQVEGQIASDAQAGLVQAVSNSWGTCEAEISRNQVNNEDAEFQLMVAAGATAFQASGDAGAYDCSTSASPDGRVAVDYPASSPYVVAVGGTSLTRSGSAWAEAAWQDPQALGPPALIYQGSASGGGTSSYEARPSWQAGLGLAGSGRLVPDIASEADPHTGMTMYISDAGGWVHGGGTSLSAPIEAALCVDAISAANRTTGLGDIHAALYAAPSSDFRDITTGGNYVYSAGDGYDEVTGRGAPLWDRLGPSLLGTPLGSAPTTAPTTPAPSATAAPTMTSTAPTSATSPTTPPPTATSTSTPTSTAPTVAPAPTVTPTPTGPPPTTGPTGPAAAPPASSASSPPASATAPPSLTAQPRADGSPHVGSRLTCNASYSGAEKTAIAWLRDRTRISGANSATYRLASADYRHDVSCRTAGYNAAGWSAASDSPAVRVGVGASLRPLSGPSVSGARSPGHTLTAHPGRWAPSATNYSYAWTRNGGLIAGATRRHYRVRRADSGAVIAVVVTARRYAYRPGTRRAEFTIR